MRRWRAEASKSALIHCFAMCALREALRLPKNPPLDQATECFRELSISRVGLIISGSLSA